MNDNRVTYFGETDARNSRVKFGIKAKDRTRHVYVIGKTGMGKSTLLENMAVQDIQGGEGMCFIDPHGKTADLLLEYVPKNRINDVVYIAPFDIEYPISFNVLESVEPDKRHLVVSGLMSTFKKIWVDAWSARMEYILTNTLLALLEMPNSTLLGVNKMLSDKEYRKEVVAHIQDPSVKSFWVNEFANYTERMAAEAVPSIQNKIGQFTANPLIRNMIGQPQSSFDFRKAMDSKKIIIINLSKGRIGDENMKLLGGMLVTKIYLSAMSRADLTDRALSVMPNFYLYVDEFQNFANASFADILSEARKYKLNLTIAHQYIEQMDEQVRAAVFGNVGTMIVFRVGATDAEVLEKEFEPEFQASDLVNLGFAQIYLKLMIDGLTSSPFSAVTLAPISHPEELYINEIIDASRKQFARPRTQVEAEIIAFHEPVKKAAPATAKKEGNFGMKNSFPEVASVAPVTAERKTASSPIHATVSPKPAIQPTVSEPPTQVQEVKEPKPNVSEPVSLNSLKKPNIANDTKTPSKKNVNDLRSALEAALKKSPSQPQPQNQTPSKPIPQNSAQNEPKNIPKSQPVVKSANESSKDLPREVPEEVLKNVLKVD